MNSEEIEEFFKKISVDEYLKYLESLDYNALFQHKRLIEKAIDNKDKRA